ncbi:MAG: hypothetical protein P8Y70_17450 [Candidatus Lokiarchaeota archaeon]
MRDVIAIVVMLSSIWTFNSFYMVYILTGGGPANRTHILPTLAFEYAIYPFPSFSQIFQENVCVIRNNKDEYYTTFLATLKDIKKVYTKIPRYFLSILLERAKIPKSKLKVLINHALKDNRLIRIKDNYFKINIEKE